MPQHKLNHAPCVGVG